ncbi:MAG: hypothetical protein HQK94_19315, partial [Nitrospirae bacterium]|nr:hypothetical protein [Nitrospirota bacterium]
MAQAGLTKITAPVLQDVIERELCFKAIDSSLQKRIVWMSAPAGSGKTTLAASYLKSRSNPFLWYHMDGTDIDVSTFFSYMTLAVKTLLHQKNAELPEFTSEYFKNVPAFAARYFKKLFTLVAEAVKEEDIYRSTETHAPFLIVFDNYQNTLADSAIHDVLGIGFSLMPEGFASIVISRLEPPIEYADLRRNGDLGFFEWNDLLFTMDDTLNLVRAFTKIEVPEEIIRQLHKKMEGWVAGLILAIERGNIASLMSFLEKTEVNEVVFDYFAREILEKTESNVRDFLFKTAYLQEFSIPMAERLTGYVHSRKILSEKHRQYFITKKHTHSGVMFVYHDLFHAFLRAHAKEYFRQNEDEIVRRAEDILEEDGYFEAAVQLCIDMSDWEKLTTIVLKHVASMIAHGRGAILNRWFAAIPDDFIEKQPWLLYWKGMNMLQTNPAETRKILEISYEKFKSTDDLKGLLSAFCSIVDTFVYEWKDFHPLDYWINEYEELTNRHKDTPLSLSFSIQDIPLELRQRLSSSIFSALMFRQPWHQDMPYWEEEVLKILRHSQNIIQLMSLGHNLILYYLYTGKIYKAGVIIETLFPVIEKSKGNLLARLMFCRSQSLYFFYSASYRQGLKVVEEGLELAREYDVHMLDLMLFGTATYISLAIGDNEAAEKYLKKMESSMVNVQCFGNIYYHQIVSLVALSRGQYKSAIDHAEINIQLTVDLGSYLILGIFEYSIAYIYTESGQYEEARHHIKESLNFGVITGSTLPTYICTML